VKYNGNTPSIHFSTATKRKHRFIGYDATFDVVSTPSSLLNPK
jgi:hypothetical protein